VNRLPGFFPDQLNILAFISSPFVLAIVAGCATRRSGKFFYFKEKLGAGDGIRTHDPNLGKVGIHPFP